MGNQITAGLLITICGILLPLLVLLQLPAFGLWGGIGMILLGFAMMALGMEITNRAGEY